MSNEDQNVKKDDEMPQRAFREGVKKIDFFLGKSPKLWAGG